MTTREKNNNDLIIVLIISIIVLVCLTSCGSRKVEKTEVKEREQKTEKTSFETETKVSDNTKIIDTSTTDEIEFIPVDNTKPIKVNGKTYFNVQIKQSKKKNNISINKGVKTQHKAKKEGLKTVKTNKEIIKKKVERKSSYWWLLILIPIYYVYRKLKNTLS
jgi:hypothetical protein